MSWGNEDEIQYVARLCSHQVKLGDGDVVEVIEGEWVPGADDFYSVWLFFVCDFIHERASSFPA